MSYSNKLWVEPDQNCSLSLKSPSNALKQFRGIHHCAALIPRSAHHQMCLLVTPVHLAAPWVLPFQTIGFPEKLTIFSWFWMLPRPYSNQHCFISANYSSSTAVVGLHVPSPRTPPQPQPPCLFISCQIPCQFLPHQFLRLFLYLFLSPDCY